MHDVDFMFVFVFELVFDLILEFGFDAGSYFDFVFDFVLVFVLILICDFIWGHVGIICLREFFLLGFVAGIICFFNYSSKETNQKTMP